MFNVLSNYTVTPNLNDELAKSIHLIFG